MAARAIVWLGGGLFVAALAICASWYVFTLGHLPGDFSSAALAFDTALFTVFALHHSVFAREPVKRWLMSLVPERLLKSVYVWVASLLLMLVCAAWRPVGGDAFEIQGWPRFIHAAVQVAGLLMIAGAVRAIDALELAGIRAHSATDSLQIAGPYRWVRHPLYLGWMMATCGPAHLTGDRFVFAAISAFYLVVAVPFEERSLIDAFGAQYLRYQQHVRWRIVPYVY